MPVRLLLLRLTGGSKTSLFSVYENPFLTATSRSVIADIQRTSRQFSSVNVLRPLAMFCTLFRLKISQHAKSTDPLFQALRVWTEIGDICESDSFDGHRKAIVEHTLNILLLPGIHHDNYKQSDSLVSTTGTPPSHPYCPSSPSLHIPGIALSIPSPLHFRLHVITRLSFNEQGRIAHHRDFWDVKDIIGLVPGVSLAQWIGTRLAAKGLSYVSKVWKDEKSGEPPSPTVVDDLETGPTASPVISTNALSLEST